MLKLIFILILLLILLFIYNCYFKRVIKLPKPAEYVSVIVETPFDLMTEQEKIDYIFNKYFDTEYDLIEKKKKEDEYIASLPVSTNCPDLFSECSKWAANDECIINPEFMLYNCPKSCGSCEYTEDDKYNVTKIYNSRPPLHNVYHGENYPGPFPFLNKMYSYPPAMTY